MKVLAGVVPPRRRPDLARRRGRRLPQPDRRARRGHRRHLPGADALPRPVGHREHLHGPPAARRARRIDRRGDARRGAARCSTGLGVRLDPSARRAACRSPTSRSSRSPRRSRSTPACSSWTSRPRRCRRRRGRAALRRRPHACATRARAVVFISPPLRRGLRPLRHGHRHARRRYVVHRRAVAEPTPSEVVRLMVGREVADAVPQGTRPRSATPVLDVARAHPRRRLPRRLLRGPRRRDRRRSPASSAPAAARSPAPSSASTAYDAGTVRLHGGPLPAGDPRAAIRARHRLRPRGPPPAGPGDGRFDRAQHRRSPSLDALRRRGLHPPRRRDAPLARDWASRAAGQARRRSTTPSSTLSRRQPAEGRARQVAGDRARSCSIIDEPTRGIDVGTKAEVHRLLCELAGAGPGRPDDLERAARGARHGRPRARHARGPADRRALARRGTQEPSCSPPPARRPPRDRDRRHSRRPPQVAEAERAPPGDRSSASARSASSPRSRCSCSSTAIIEPRFRRADGSRDLLLTRRSSRCSRSARPS